MGLIERVATLLRANVNDLLDRAENPEVTFKQLVLDMENQLLQVKTQVAIALADQHLLEKKAKEQELIASDWHRKAELAVSQGEDALARAALERAITSEAQLTAYRAQIADGSAEAETLRASYAQLEAKLVETRAECERLVAQHRRARMLANLAESRSQPGGRQGSEVERHAVASRVRENLKRSEAVSQAHRESPPLQYLEKRFADLEKAGLVERLLKELKTQQDSGPKASPEAVSLTER